VVLNENDAARGAEIVPELRGRLQQTLPEYMVPSTIVVLAALPRTASGKIDRGALPPPDAMRPLGESTYVRPRTPLEQAIAETWSELLGISDVGVNDHFFADLGGH